MATLQVRHSRRCVGGTRWATAADAACICGPRFYVCTHTRRGGRRSVGSDFAVAQQHLEEARRCEAMRSPLADIPQLDLTKLNRREAQAARNLEAQGVRLLRRGWPDLIGVWPDGTIRGVEVKSANPRDGARATKCSAAQEQMHALLGRAGIRTEVVEVQ